MPQSTLTRIRNIVRNGQPELNSDEIDLLLTAELQDFHDGQRRKWVSHLQRRAVQLSRVEPATLQRAMQRYMRDGLSHQQLQGELDRCMDVLRQRDQMNRANEEIRARAAAELKEALATWALEHSTPEDFEAVPELAEYVKNPHVE